MNICRAIITGNLTRDPELKQTPGGADVCQLRVAVNTRRKDGDQWVDKPNFFDVTVWGGQAKSCAAHLGKGRGVAIDGRLHWREWEHEGVKRQAVSIIADNVSFLGSPNAQPTAPGNEPGDAIPGADDASRAGGGDQLAQATAGLAGGAQNFGATGSGFELEGTQS